MSERVAQTRSFLLYMGGTSLQGDQLIDAALDFIAVLRQQGNG
jgi:hypothetical protein